MFLILHVPTGAMDGYYVDYGLAKTVMESCHKPSFLGKWELIDLSEISSKDPAPIPEEHFHNSAKKAFMLSFFQGEEPN